MAIRRRCTQCCASLDSSILRRHSVDFEHSRCCAAHQKTSAQPRDLGLEARAIWRRRYSQFS
jgi:hypothetical protein